MPGDEWQKFANLRLLFGYMFGQPGKKLIFMGGEFGQWAGWDHDKSLDWHLLEYPSHQKLQRWLQDLNRLLKEEPALHEGDCESWGFQWVDSSDWQQSVISLQRRDKSGANIILAVFSFTPVPRENYRIGVPLPGFWKEILNSDSQDYGGSGWGNYGGLKTAPIASHGQYQSLNLTLPPLAALFFKREADQAA
jgi:1,4-alpha-glucan branching enzyme